MCVLMPKLEVLLASSAPMTDCRLGIAPQQHGRDGQSLKDCGGDEDPWRSPCTRARGRWRQLANETECDRTECECRLSDADNERDDALDLLTHELDLSDERRQ
jgi:hypothetical protein